MTERDDPKQGFPLTSPGPLERFTVAHPVAAVALVAAVAVVVGLLAVRALWL